MNIDSIIARMTLREKIAFCTGEDFWHTKALPAACFPAAVTSGVSWHPELYAEEDAAIGREALAAGVSVVLGPGCNIKRNPLGGRNFEYLWGISTWPGKWPQPSSAGVQGTGAPACLKHFAANSQEFKRMNGDSQVDEQALREIYLAAFELAVKEGRPATVMCAYNKINGEHCSDSKTMLADILRSEWGFDGAVITDWGAMNDRILAFRAGCDLSMPGGSDYMEQTAVKAVRSGSPRKARYC